MEVIKSGKRIVDTVWYGECDKCGAIISAHGNELKGITKGDYRSDDEDFAWEDCPDCKASHSVCFHEKNTKSGMRVYEKVDF